MVSQGALAYAGSAAARAASQAAEEEQEERDFNAAWSAAAAEGGGDPLAQRRASLRQDNDSDEWEDRCVMQIGALAEGLCKNSSMVR